jgi:hypothetical protein
MDKQKQKPIRVMGIYPEMKLVPKKKDSNLIAVDVQMEGRCLITSPEIEGLGETPAEQYCEAMNTIALALVNLSVFSGKTLLNTAAELTSRLSHIDTYAQQAETAPEPENKPTGPRLVADDKS